MYRLTNIIRTFKSLTNTKHNLLVVHSYCNDKSTSQIDKPNIMLNNSCDSSDTKSLLGIQLIREKHYDVITNPWSGKPISKSTKKFNRKDIVCVINNYFT